MPANSWIDWGKRHQIALVLGLILLISLFLRFYDLGAESLWLDEAESIKESSLSVQGIADHSNQPPFYFLLLRGWIHLFGTSEAAIRSLSAIFGVLAVWLIFLVGKALFNPRVGLTGAFLAAFAYFPIYHSQDARAYSLLLFLSLLSYWLFIKIIKTGKKWYYPAYLFAGLLLVYTHFYGLFIIFSQVVFFLIFFKQFKTQRWKFITTIAALVLVLIPSIWLLRDRISSIAGNGFWLPRPGFSHIRDNFVNFSGTGSTRYVVLVLFVLLAVLGFWAVRQAEEKFSQGKTKKHQGNPVWQTRLESPQTIVLLLLWLCVPILIPFIESQVMTPVYQAKYTLGAYPAFCLLIANGLNNIRWRWVFYPVLVLIVVLSSIGLSTYYRYDVKEQWREAAQLVDSRAQSGDVIVICEGYYRSAFDYYYRGNLREEGIFNLEDARKFVSAETENIAGKQGSVWLIVAYNHDPIVNYFVDYYGRKAMELGRGYMGVTVFRFNLAGFVR
jgi:mannosyltransferase